MTKKQGFQIWIIGLISIVLSSCNARTEKEFVYHRDQNNRLYAVSEVQHIKHEQVMDLMPKSMDKLAMLNDSNKLGSVLSDKKHEVYEQLVKKNLSTLSSGFYCELIGYLLATIGVAIFISSLDGNLDTIATGILSLLFLAGLGSIVAIIAHVFQILGVIQYSDLQKFKKENKIDKKESGWHIFLYYFSIAMLLLLILGIILEVIAIINGKF